MYRPFALPGAPAPKQGDYDEAIAVDGEGNPTEFPSWTTLPLYVGASKRTQQLQIQGRLYRLPQLTICARCWRTAPGKTPADSECKTGDVVLDRTGSTNPLELIPFFDVQMTKLNRWNETPVPNVPVDTTNQPLANNNAHSRGVISKSEDGAVNGGCERSPGQHRLHRYLSD